MGRPFRGEDLLVSWEGDGVDGASGAARPKASNPVLGEGDLTTSVTFLFDNPFLFFVVEGELSGPCRGMRFRGVHQPADF